MQDHRWQKKEKSGIHLLKWQGKRYTIRPGDEVDLPPEALGDFVDRYNHISGPPDEKKGVTYLSADRKMEDGSGPAMKHVGGGYWNVINPDNPDKPLNDRPLRKESAEALIRGG